MNRKRRYKRGFSVALLIGFEDDYTLFWEIFSNVVKLSLKLELNGKRSDEKILYNFHESIVDAVKSVLKKGVKSIIITAPSRTTYTQDFLEHVRKHHKYLIQSKRPTFVHFAELVGSINDRIKVSKLIKSKEFINLITKTTSEEADHVVKNLEKHLYGNINNSIVIYSLNEIEGTIHNQEKTKISKDEYLLLTDKYLVESKQKNRIHRLLQISKNKKIKTRVIAAETPAGNRISQFGGLVFFATLSKENND